MTDFKWHSIEQFDLQTHTILLTLAGSRSYGTDHPLSDTDYKGILIPPKEYMVSPFKNFEQTIWTHKETNSEGTIFGLRKFFNLASNCNPNVVENLFVDPKHIIHCTPLGTKLIEHREQFLSQRAARTFCGYGMSQLKRIRTHREWLLNPIETKPERTNYNLPAIKQLGAAELGAVHALVRRNLNTMAPWLQDADNQHKEAFWTGVVNLVAIILENEGYAFDADKDNWFKIEEEAAEAVAARLSFDSEFSEYLKEEKRYGQAIHQWKQYKAWVRNRNPARAELEARYGYDCKHAMHLVRLLTMAEELVTTGTMNVLRPDAQHLIEIRNGKIPYDELITWADKQQDRIYDKVRSGTCPLPKNPNQKALETLYMELVESHWIQ